MSKHTRSISLRLRIIRLSLFTVAVIAGYFTAVLVPHSWPTGWVVATVIYVGSLAAIIAALVFSAVAELRDEYLDRTHPRRCTATYHFPPPFRVVDNEHLPSN